MPHIDREGTFESRIKDARMARTDGGAIMAYLDFEVIRQYNPATKSYGDVWPPDHTFPGSVCLVKRDGGTMDSAIENLVLATGWNGEENGFHAIIGNVCQCKVVSESYTTNTGQTRTSLRAKYINPIGGAARKDDTEEVFGEFGAIFKDIAARVGPITPASAPTPVTPPPPHPPAAPAAPAAELVQPDPNDTVNF